MASWIYDYVDGAPTEVRAGISVDVVNFHDYQNKNCISVTSRMSGSDYFSFDIPTQNIVDIQHFEVEERGKKKGLLYGAIGGVALAGLLLTPLGPVIMGAQVMALVGKITVGAALFSGVSTGLIVGTGADVLKELKERLTKNNVFMISYLEEKDPENLRVIVFEHGKTFLKDAMKFFDKLIEQDATVKKSYFVDRFIKRLNDEVVDDTEANFLMKISPAHSIFKIPGNGTTVTGKVGMGKINRGDYAWVCSPTYAKMTKVKIATIKKAKDEVDSIAYGDNASILLEGITNAGIGENFILTTNVIDTTAGSSNGRGAIVFYADVKAFDESGRKESLMNGEYIFEFGNDMVIGVVELPPVLKNGALAHGEEDAIKVTLEEPIVTCVGAKFSIKVDFGSTANGIVIATGVVSDFD